MKELRFVAYAYWKSYADRGLSALLQILLIVYPIDFVFCNQFGCGNSTGYFRIVFDYIHRVALGGVRLETDLPLIMKLAFSQLIWASSLLLFLMIIFQKSLFGMN